jgi:hypothetical protein
LMHRWPLWSSCKKLLQIPFGTHWYTDCVACICIGALRME